ncbi:hypothetical protein BDV93DRAFT_487981 [Ceratobasidium sp. AG-I]|nr:hypothetical protein BDV93DRAFT_487981 [Ceratobasidium sp. AG-I]
MAFNPHPLNKLTLAPHADKDDAQTHEDQYVHDVYDQIAPHFSQTRYKPWPVIANFLESIPSGALGLDAGTGNGKYLPLSEGRFLTVGTDRSIGLLKFAQYAGESATPRDVLLSDVRDHIWRKGVFDFAISIATIHHLATPERRAEAVKAILDSLLPSGGRALLYVWAVEQDGLSKRVVPDTVSGEPSSSKAQDVLVPWIMQQQQQPKPKSKSRRGRPKPDSTQTQDPTDSSAPTPTPEQPSAPVFQRYYHLFVAGELTKLATTAAEQLGLTVGPKPSEGSGQQGVQISDEGWERSNLYIELTRWSL